MEAEAVPCQPDLGFSRALEGRVASQAAKRGEDFCLDRLAVAKAFLDIYVLAGFWLNRISFTRPPTLFQSPLP